MMHADEILAQWPETALVADVIAGALSQHPQHRDRLPRLEGAGRAVRPAGRGSSGSRRHRHRPRHRDAGGNRVFPQPDAEGVRPGGAGRLAAPLQRAVQRCRHEPGQRHPRRRQPGSPRHGRAGGAERRDPGGARGDEDLHAAPADIPHRRISACSAMPMATRSRSIAARCAAAAPDTEFDIRALDALPRVDISYAYAGGDGTAVRAFVAAGAQGHRLRRVCARVLPRRANSRR